MRGSFVIGAIVVVGCSVTDLDLTGKLCPCPEGYFCEPTGRCAAGLGTAAVDGGQGATGDPCFDGVRNGDETDTDCGGSCGRCLGAPCANDAECATEACVADTCELASGPPEWLAVASLPTARFALAATTASDGRIYAIDGFDNGSLSTGWAFRPTPPPLGSWETVPSLAIARRGIAAVTAVDGTLHVLGGKSELAGGTWYANVETLAVGASSWIAGPPLKEARHRPVAAVGGDGRIYVTGGGNDAVPALASTERLGVGAAEWTAAAPMKKARSSAAGVSARGFVYVCGGWDGEKALSECELFSPTENRWRDAASLAAPRTSFAAAVGADQRIYAIGGSTDDLGNAPALATVEAFTVPVDPTQSPGRWTGAVSLPKPVTLLAAAAGLDGCVYALGGIQSTGGTLNLADAVAYCPRVALSPTSGPAGTRIVVSGTNFAANARVRVFLSNQSSPVAVAMTDARGVIVGTPSFTVPGACAAPCMVTCIDHRSRFPVRAELFPSSP